MRRIRYHASYAVLVLTLAGSDGQTNPTTLGGVQVVGNQRRFLRTGTGAELRRTSSGKTISRADGVIRLQGVKTPTERSCQIPRIEEPATNFV